MVLLRSSSFARALLIAVLVAIADASLDADAALAPDSPGGSLSTAPKAPEPRSLEQDLFACRVACHAETWDPVCVGGNMTYANACWTRCASSSQAETPLEVTPGKCQRERAPEPSCVSGCVDSWGREKKPDGTAAFAWRPACGEDGVTYTTSCFAGCSGVMSGEGECHDVDPRRRR